MELLVLGMPVLAAPCSCEPVHPPFPELVGVGCLSLKNKDPIPSVSFTAHVHVHTHTYAHTQTSCTLQSVDSRLRPMVT